MTMTTCKRRVQTNGDLVVETRIPKWDPVREGELIRTLGGCDNTSRPGFRIDPPFAWETAHEAYFGAVASAQDLLEVTPVSTSIWWKQGQICLMADLAQRTLEQVMCPVTRPQRLPRVRPPCPLRQRT